MTLSCCLVTPGNAVAVCPLADARGFWQLLVLYCPKVCTAEIVCCTSVLKAAQTVTTKSKFRHQLLH